MRLPAGWKENDQCVELFVEVRAKMRAVLASPAATESKSPSVPDAIACQVIAAPPVPERIPQPKLPPDGVQNMDHPNRLGNFLRSHKLFIARSRLRGQRWDCLGKFLCNRYVAARFVNPDGKDDYMVTEPRSAHHMLAELAKSVGNEFDLMEYY